MAQSPVQSIGTAELSPEIRVEDAMQSELAALLNNSLDDNFQWLNDEIEKVEEMLVCTAQNTLLLVHLTGPVRWRDLQGADFPAERGTK